MSFFIPLFKQYIVAIKKYKEEVLFDTVSYFNVPFCNLTNLEIGWTIFKY
ncbi:putative transcriptional regulator [Bacillus sp. TS-2]|nr:putative transcriptional regulator [Bacillus sp. TS-2]